MDYAIHIFNRHRGDEEDIHPHQEEMLKAKQVNTQCGYIGSVGIWHGYSESGYTVALCICRFLYDIKLWIYDCACNLFVVLPLWLSGYTTFWVNGTILRHPL